MGMTRCSTAGIHSKIKRKPKETVKKSKMPPSGSLPHRFENSTEIIRQSNLNIQMSSWNGRCLFSKCKQETE